MLELSARVAADPALTALFDAEPDDTRLWARLAEAQEHAEFGGELRAYLDRFGDRCANELKLETLTHGDDPSFLVRLVRTAGDRHKLNAVFDALDDDSSGLDARQRELLAEFRKMIPRPAATTAPRSPKSLAAPVRAGAKRKPQARGRRIAATSGA